MSDDTILCGINDSVGILTVTRERPNLLRRAIQSVNMQRCNAHLRHLVVVDDCDVTVSMLNSLEPGPIPLSWKLLPRGEGDETGPRRCAICLNYGVRLLNTKWIAFLDDDNEFEPQHIESLLQCALRSSCRAVHSYMKMYHADGRPFLDHRNPWCRVHEEALTEYEWMVSRGVRSPGSNIVKDSINPVDHAPVDLGEWLLRHDLLDEIPFQFEYTEEDLRIGRHEDDVFLETLIARKEPIACSGMATLKYYLGGFSTCTGGYANPYGGTDDC